MLSTTRQSTFGGAGPIPFNHILEYFKWQEIEDRDEQSDYIYLIGQMDKTYMAHLAKMQKSKEGGK